MKRIQYVIAAAAAAALFGLIVTTQASAAGYLKFDGVDGEAADKHKGEIEILSWSWGASNPGGGIATGKRMHKPMTISKPLDRGSVFVRTSPGSACTPGAASDSAEIGDAAQRWELKNVVVSSCAPNGMTLDYVGISEVAAAQ